MTNFCKKIALKGVFFIACLLTAIAASAEGTDLKTPYLFISKLAYGDAVGTPTFFNDKQFEEPALNVYENEDKTIPVTSRFTFSFYLTSNNEKGEEVKGTTVVDKEKKEWCVDEVTGTRVNIRTGDVETGSNPGKVFVHVKITPREAYKNMFASVEKCYTITLDPIKAEVPARVLPEFVEQQYKDSWTAITGTNIALPKFSLQYTVSKNGVTSVIDLTDKYIVTAQVATRSASLVTIDNEYKTKNLYNKEVTAPIIKVGNEPGEATLVFSFKPVSSSYQVIDDMYVPLTIVDGKVTPNLVFSQTRQIKYTGMQGDSLQRPTVYDQYGNDITASVATPNVGDGEKPLCIAWTAYDLQGKDMHDVPTSQVATLYIPKEPSQPVPDDIYRAGGGPVIYSLDGLNVGDMAYYRNQLATPFSVIPSEGQDWQIRNQCRQASYDANIYCMVYPNPSVKGSSDKYVPKEDKYVINIGPRPVDLILTPAPSTIKFANGVEMDFKNFFDVKAQHVCMINDTRKAEPHEVGDTITLSHYTDKNVESYGYGFNYWIKFKRGDVELKNYPYEDDKAYHIVVDKDGNKIADPKTYDGDIYDVYWAIKKHAGDSDWKMIFPKNGKFAIQFGLDYYNKGYYSAAQTSVEKTFEIEDKITPVIKVTPDPLVLYTTDTQLPSQPVVTITDALGKDIKINYTYKFDESTLPTGFKLDENGDIVIDLDENGKPKTVKGDWKDVKVIATPKDITGKYAEAETTFRIIVKDLGERMRFEWNVYNEYATDAADNNDITSVSDKQHGKLVFTKAGAVSGGYTIDAVPGLSVTLGKFNEADDEDNYWSADNADDGKVYVGDGTVMFGDNGLPIHGTYYVLKPRTNGFLTVDVNSTNGHTISLITSDGKKSQKKVVNADGESIISFSMPLYGGTTYYLFDESNDALKLHGLNYLPAFVRFENDNAPIVAATAYANGFAGELPRLTQANTTVDASLVGYALHGHSEKSEVINDFDAYVNFEAATGYVSTSGSSTFGLKGCTAEKLDENFKPLDTKENRIKVYAKVKSAWKDNIMQIPFYDLYVGAIPTYVVGDGEIPNVRQVVSTTNYPTYINAIFGGWENDADKPYFKKNDKTLEALVDSWKTAKKDSVGQNNRTVDNFAFATFGTQNATSETVTPYKFDKANEDLTYSLPCRGTYAQFEPMENGTLLVYIIQNGMVAWDGNQENKDKSGNNKAKVNPVFITDETGHPVKLSALASTQDVSDGGGNAAYTEAIVRCSYKELIDNCYDGKDLNTEDANAKSDKDAIALLKKIGYMPDGETGAKINRNDPVEVYDVATTLGTGEAGSQGYSVISKAYVRYSFKVKAGKTYFVFMTRSKLGNNGFAFLPDGWTPDRKEPTVNTVVLDEKGSAADSKDEFIKNPENFAHYDEAVNVKLYHSGLKANQWTSICLPFSMNEDQFTKTFGKDAWIISFDNVVNQETIDGEVYDNVASFTQHRYHWIVAGRPYFIRPGKDFKFTSEDEGRGYILCDSVTFEHGSYDAEGTGNSYVKPMTLTQNKTNFHFVGNYDVTKMKIGDYFMGYSTSTDGEQTAMLFRDDTGWDLNGYRAHISLQGQSDARLNSMHIGEIDEEGGNQTSSIANIFDVPTDRQLISAMKNGIYGIDGTKISDMPADLDALPAGVYVVNGKCIVK